MFVPEHSSTAPLHRPIILTLAGAQPGGVIQRRKTICCHNHVNHSAPDNVLVHGSVRPRRYGKLLDSYASYRWKCYGSNPLTERME